MTNDAGKSRHWQPWALVIALICVALLSDTASTASQARPGGYWASFRLAFVNELGSCLIWALLLPVIVTLFRRINPSRLPLPWVLVVHALAIPCISMAHYLLKPALLTLLFAIGGRDYPFHFSWPAVVYDLYKDAFNYCTLGFFYVAADRLFRKPEEKGPIINDAVSPGDQLEERINAIVLEVRDGSKIEYISSANILWAEAAGNYVELHLSNGLSTLMRSSLSSLAARLEGRGFTRVHRSRLVNLAEVKRLENLRGGDGILHLTDGRKVAVSRSHRSDVNRAIQHSVGRQAMRRPA